MQGTDPQQQQHSPALDAYAAASQKCRDIAQEVGVQNCDDSPEWRAAEREAEARFTDAQTVGHSIADILKAGRQQ